MLSGRAIGMWVFFALFFAFSVGTYLRLESKEKYKKIYVFLLIPFVAMFGYVSWMKFTIDNIVNKKIPTKNALRFFITLSVAYFYVAPCFCEDVAAVLCNKRVRKTTKNMSFQIKREWDEALNGYRFG